MNIEMKCPLDLGDEVYFTVTERFEDGEIKCPFCHGNPVVDTGITAWQLDGPMAVIGSHWVERPLILTCINCEGTGKIKYHLPPVKTDIYGTLTGIYKITDIDDWANNIYIVTGDDGVDYYVNGCDLRVD